MREHTRPLRDFRGETRPETELAFTSIAPWDASVTVTYVQLAGIGRRLQVTARWHGPPLPGSPPAQRPVWATDCYVIDAADEAALAFAVAHHARDDLAAARVPDLRSVAARLRRRAK
jgi:hypothetical protein